MLLWWVSLKDDGTDDDIVR